VLLSTAAWFQAPLESSNVLPDSTRAFSDAAENTCSYGGAFRILLQGFLNFGTAKTSVQVCRRLGAIF